MTRGRPRKEGARYQSGGLKPTRDHGTPELQLKRLAIVGTEGNPNLSTCPVDALLARKLISQDEYNDACDYRRWFTMSVRRGVPSIADGSVANDMVDDKALEDAMRKYKAAAAVLMKVSRKAKDALENAVIYERFPRFLIVGAGNRKSDVHLFAAFHALTQWRRGEKRAA